MIQEEARHILLFANWLAWHRKRLGPWRRLRFELRVVRAWIFLAWERIGIARGMDGGEKHRTTISPSTAARRSATSTSARST